MLKNKKLWMAVAAVVVIAIIVWKCSGGKEEQEVSFETAKVERQDIHTSITATGTIEPVTSVTVGTQVSGIVSKLYVDYNSVVKKGQVIAELDKTNPRLALTNVHELSGFCAASLAICASRHSFKETS